MTEPLWLTHSSLLEVESLLGQNGLLHPGESVAKLEPAGEGNMNVTLRATLETTSDSSSGRTLIIKQSRPYVAKYESIPAPLNRIEFEADFYQFAASVPRLSELMPRLMGWIPQHYVLLLEDLGAAADATSLYRRASASAIDTASMKTLLNWLSTLHTESRAGIDSRAFLNLELRQLNHAHIFTLPFQDPPVTDLDLQIDGLTQATCAIRDSNVLRSRCAELGELYLAEGDCLLHGDFYPGSWLITAAGPKVIDPEFCYVGKAEFDYGVLLAHLRLCGSSELQSQVQTHLSEQTAELSLVLIEQFAAVEVLRRLLGVAQLPLEKTLEERFVLIESAAQYLTT